MRKLGSVKEYMLRRVMNPLRIITTILVWTSCFSASAQQFCDPCKDSTKYENEFFNCTQDYNPVCGCDGKTYRNDCFALNKYAFFPCGYISGICGNFDVDLSPNIVAYSIELKAYMNSSGYMQVNVFDAFGHLQVQKNFPMQQNVFQGGSLGPYNKVTLDCSTWNAGIYLIEIVYELVPKVFKVQKLSTF